MICFRFFTDVFLEQNLAPSRGIADTGERTNEKVKGRKAGFRGRGQREEGQASGPG